MDPSSTEASEADDDFFSSWDKPSIKRPTPPISRTATPPVTGRTPSPFLNANKDAISRSASPLSKPASPGAAESKPTTGRITSSAALRKTTTASGPRKTSVLGAKKTQKLGAKKVTGDVIDFDEAEKRAKEEAERIAKLGYDPDAEDEQAPAADKGSAATPLSSATPISTPAPASSAAAGAGASAHTRQKSNAEVERLGMGLGRLGFGQVGGPKGAAAAPAAKKNAGGFGSVGPVKASEGTFSSLLCPPVMLTPPR